MKTFLKLSCIVFLCCFAFSFCHAQDFKQQIIETLRDQDLQEASWAMQQTPITVTAETCNKSAGGKHDFFSQADYFWPDPEHPDGPYINRDGLTNPDNFIAHRLAMIRFSKIIASLASAYVLTHDEKYVHHAITHLKAWFVRFCQQKEITFGIMRPQIKDRSLMESTFCILILKINRNGLL